MKKFISLFLCLVMLSVLLTPVSSSAAADKGLENAIRVAKSQFNIPKSNSFNFDVYTQDSKKVWSLNWTSKSANGENISVRVDEDGKILNYDNYKPYDVSKKKLPVISKAEAKVKAQTFVKKLNPDIYTQLKLIDNLQSSSLDYGYSFSFMRTVKNIPYYANGVNVVVNKDTGAVQSYYNNWTSGLVFPDASKAISIEAAQKAFKDKLGLELIYKYSYQNEKLRIYPVYTTKFSNETYAIDALLGEKVQTGYAYSTFDRGGMGGSEYSMKAMDATASNVVLTPEEIKAVDEVSKLMSQEDAEKLARGLKLLKLTDDFKLESANLSRNWPIRADYQWQLNFRKIENEKTKEAQYLYVSINAKTGDLLNFNKNSSYYGEKEIAKFDEKAAKAAVEAFLKEIQPVKFNETEFDSTSNVNLKIEMAADRPLQYNFSYIRKVNGVKFPDNNMTVGFDAVSGEVTNFYMTWFSSEFPSVSKVISLDTAYEKMFSGIGLELQYKLKFVDKSDGKRIIQPQNAIQDIVLVYALKNNKPLFLDAMTGNVLDYDGNLYKESLPVQYTDISGHYAEKQIMLLAEYGISLGDTKFKPDDYITQKDYMLLLSKTLSNYYGPILSTTSSNEEIENLYTTMIREGIIKETEKAPTAKVKREDGVKFIIRALKYDKVAGIKGIYKSGIKDINKVTSGLVGHIVIAQGLNIINVDKKNFRPQDSLTRADAMVMLYNYLQQ